MKIKRIIYFICILLGALMMGLGGKWMPQEYAQIIGIVLLMFGVYCTTRVQSSQTEENHGEGE